MWGSCLISSFSCLGCLSRTLVGDEEKDAAAKIDLDKQRVEAWGRVVGKAASNDLKGSL